MLSNKLYYTGQRRSPVTGSYLLGNGYRGFNPVIKRFTSQDNSSPFGLGGMHGFSYCNGDSVNSSDVTGHGPFLDLFIGLLDYRLASRASAAELSAETKILGVSKDVGLYAAFQDGTATIIDSSGGVFTSSNDALKFFGRYANELFSEGYGFTLGSNKSGDLVGDYLGIINKKIPPRYKLNLKFEVEGGRLTKINLERFDMVVNQHIDTLSIDISEEESRAVEHNALNDMVLDKLREDSHRNTKPLNRRLRRAFYRNSEYGTGTNTPDYSSLSNVDDELFDDDIIWGEDENNPFNIYPLISYEG